MTTEIAMHEPDDESTADLAMRFEMMKQRAETAERQVDALRRKCASVGAERDKAIAERPSLFDLDAMRRELAGERGALRATRDTIEQMTARMGELERERDEAQARAAALHRALPSGWSNNAWFPVCDRLIEQEARIAELESLADAQTDNLTAEIVAVREAHARIAALEAAVREAPCPRIGELTEMCVMCSCWKRRALEGSNDG